MTTDVSKHAQLYTYSQQFLTVIALLGFYDFRSPILDLFITLICIPVPTFYSRYMQSVHIYSQSFYYLSISLLMQDDVIIFGRSAAGLTGYPEECWQAFCAVHLSCWR
jgi:hypothetical protein